MTEKGGVGGNMQQRSQVGLEPGMLGLHVNILELLAFRLPQILNSTDLKEHIGYLEIPSTCVLIRLD